MGDLYLAIGGVVVATLTAIYSTMIDKSKSITERWILVVVALIGLGLGAGGAWKQQKSADKSEQALKDLQTKVGDLDEVQQKIDARSGDLTKLNLLGDGVYYVVIGTYRDTPANAHEYQKVLGDFKGEFPKAESNGMIWKHPLTDGQYEMAFGRHLTPAAAEVYLRLGDALAPGKTPRIRRER